MPTKNASYTKEIIWRQSIAVGLQIIEINFLFKKDDNMWTVISATAIVCLCSCSLLSATMMPTQLHS